MRLIKTCCAAALALAFLTACGSKGALYLPKPDPTVAPAPTKDSAKAGAEAGQ